MKTPNSLYLAAVISLLLASPHVASAQTVDTWTGATSSEWDNGTANWSPNGTFTNGDNALFNGSGPTTITVQAGGVTVGSSGNTNRNALEVSSGDYTIGGGDITLSGGNDVGIYVDPGATATINSAIDYTSGNSVYFNVANNFAGGGTLNLTGGMAVGNVSNGAGSNTLVLGSGGTINMSAGNYDAGFVFNYGGAVNLTGTAYLGAQYYQAQGNTTINSAGASLNAVYYGLDVTGSSAQLNLTAGTVNVGNGSVMTVESGGVFTNNGGTATAAGIALKTGGTFNHSAGTTYLGASGITSDGTGAVNLSGGIIGATASWSSSMNLSLTGGTTTFQAADSMGNAFGITLTGNLSGAGGLVDAGGGGLTLGGMNSFSGSAEVLNNALFTLDAATGLSNLSALLMDGSGSFTNLNFTGTDTIHSLTVDGTAVGAGTYSASALNTLLGGDQFTGSGSLDVLTGAVPEPGTLALLLGAFGFMVLVLRWKNKTALI